MRGDIVYGGALLGWRALLTLGGCLLLAGCELPPRSFIDFMDDAIARDGTLARCNRDRRATADDIECMNARRAAAVIAARADAARRQQLELESERKRAALRAQIAAQQEAEAQAAAAAAAERAAYDARWGDDAVPASADRLAENEVSVAPLALPSTSEATKAPSEAVIPQPSHRPQGASTDPQ